ncbi:DNA cytosine methyltransferase [Thorsellia anophelis]|uniref:DNA (cytosine-5-)-methyltransferase n=1 Tax=Thorsellia anophelis DSM 18579 TaxID=1123402 RepID=A0A1I0CE55_9GAMM|nr:DNA cytosine methyltransferase [Thorsellia anophelis]SET17594.1 DNA (cytosine-5)-methyltransferase 1 [Thorsellia anophelis DSM 18579]
MKRKAAKKYSNSELEDTSFSLISLFSGAGGLDLGFHKAGFNTIWANEFDSGISPSFKNHFPDVKLDTRSITSINNQEIPNAIGVIGGPPCQSWSEAGARRGISDQRGQLFFEFIRVLKHIRPLFFVAENVAGLLHQRNSDAFNEIIKMLEEAGYDVFYQKLNASDYGVPQDRKRVFIVGFKKELKISYKFPEPLNEKKTLKDTIYDLKGLPLGSDYKDIKNHEITDTGYSSMFMSRNRVRGWDEQSFTILATDRHTPLHPQAPKMVVNEEETDRKKFAPGYEHLYRRLSVRECARIQTFPDDYEFIYNHPRIGYKMVGNAVPVELAYHIAKSIKIHLE